MEDIKRLRNDFEVQSDILSLDMDQFLNKYTTSSLMETEEIYLISGEPVSEIEKELEDYKENYSETIDVIYDVIIYS